jgi:hypothetical protein
MLFGGTRGCATVFASTGKCETFVNKNTTGLNAEWGYSTDHCGYGQQETKKNKFVASKPAGTLPVKPPAEDGKVAPAATTPAGMVNIKPSSLIQGNTNAMKFYMEATGWTEAEVKEKIPNYMFRTEVVQVPEAKLPELRKKQFAKNFNVVVTTPAPAAAAAPTSVPVVSAVASKSKGNTPVVDGKTKVVAVPLPIMSTATKSAVTSWMDTELPKTILDSSSKKTSTIEEIKTLNQNYADWFRQLSKEDQREASVFWPYQMIHDQTRPEPANTREARIQSQGILCFNMMCRAALAEDRVKQLEEKYEPAEPVVTEVVVVGSSDIGVRKNKFTASKLKTG